MTASSRARALLSRPRSQLACLVGASAALHAAYLSFALHDPYLQHRVVDEVFYHQWGQAIASGALTSELPFFTSPLFAYWLGLLYSLAGDSVATVVVANAVLGVATVALTWGAALRLVGARAALVAGALVVACRAPLFYAGLTEKSALVLFVTALAVFAFAWAQGRPGTGRLAVAGMAAGAATLAHPLLLVMAFAVAVHALASGGGVRRAIGVVAPYAAGALVAVVPATLHNFAKSGELIPVCWNGGAALYGGNQSWNTLGMYAPPPFSRATIQSEIHDYWREAERRAGRAMTPAETSAFWTREALREMWEVPRLTVERWGRRLRWAVNDEELQDSRTFSFYVQRSTTLRVLPWGFGAVALLGLLGAVSSWRDRRLLVLLAFSAAYAGALAIFFVYGRYRLPLLVPLAILAGTLPARVASLLRERRARALAAVAVVAAPIAALVFVRPLTHRESFFVDYNNLAATYQQLGRADEAVAELEKAVTVRPGDDPRVAEVAVELALHFVAAGDRDRALRLLDAALRARPGDEALESALGVIRRGRAAGAPR